MFTSTIVPVTIHGKQYGLQWTFDAQAAAEKIWGSIRNAKQFAAALADYGAANGEAALCRELGHCMLQSVENPPSKKDLGRMTPDEFIPFMAAVGKALGLGDGGPFGPDDAKKNDGPEESGAPEPSGTGGRPSSKPSTAVGSRRRSSSGSRLGNSG